MTSNKKVYGSAIVKSYMNKLSIINIKDLNKPYITTINIKISPALIPTINSNLTSEAFNTENPSVLNPSSFPTYQPFNHISKKTYIYTNTKT